MTFIALLQMQKKHLVEQGLYRIKKVCNNSLVSNFSRNDYLSMAADKRVRAAYVQGFNRYPAGSSGSVVLSGYHRVHQQLESDFAQLLNVDAALLFNSGYSANLSVINLLAQFKVPLWIDKAIHASIYDGLKQTGALYQRYLHDNLADLAAKMGTTEQVVLTEALFSMSGQQPNLAKLSRLCEPSRSICVVDEAHSFGVVGPQGLGAVAQYQLSQHQVPLRMISFGKALCAQGAVVVGDKLWIDALFQAARALRYSTSLSPALTWGVGQSLALLVQADDKRQMLVDNINYFNHITSHSPLIWQNSQSPIQQLQLGCPHLALNLAQHLLTHGIFCLAIQPPTVPRKASGLRISLNANHTQREINSLIALIHDYCHA